MRIFVTGASGYIGNCVARAFARAGHRVVGLVRSEASAKELCSQEIHPLLGELGKPATYAQGVKEAEAVIHCAFGASGESAANDPSVMEALLQLCTTPKTVVYTSGVWVYGNQEHPVDEASTLTPIKLVAWRPAVEEKVLKSSSPILKSVVIRPGHVYGYAKGLMGMIFESAAKGTLEIVGNGENHWALVHVEDLAQLYVLAVEKELTRTILNGTEAPSIKVKEIAEAVAKLSGSKIDYIPYPKAVERFGPLAEGLAINQRHISNDRAARLLNWRPRRNNFVTEIETYWNAWKCSQ